MVGHDVELPLAKVVGVRANGGEHAEEFSIVGAVTLLGFVELFAAICHHLLLAVILLR